jgi:hypothetical protein
MSNKYNLAYTRITGYASDLYTEFVYGWINPDDYIKLMGILEANGMTDQADEVKAEIEGYIAEEFGDADAGEGRDED